MKKIYFAIIVLSIGLLVLYTSQPSPKIQEELPEVKKPIPTETKPIVEQSRSSRKGPKKPPLSRKSKSNSNQPIKEKQPTIDENEEQDQELEEKRREYFETLDEIDNPNVNEQIMLGEMAFYANEAESAYEHYLDVIDNHSDDPMAPFALYKFAWVQYNLGDVDYAIQDMELVLEWIETGALNQEEVLRMAVPTDLELFKKSLQ